MTDPRRQRMVDRHVFARGVRDPLVLAAMAEVPREAFLPPELAEFAYEDRPLPIEAGQTISQPYIVALMAEALKLTPGEDVLEVGTGSGYAAAVLGRIARRVYTIERHAELAETARERLARLGFENVECSPRRWHPRLAGARAVRRDRGRGRRPGSSARVARAARDRRPAGDPRRGKPRATARAHHAAGGGGVRAGGSGRGAVRAADRRAGLGRDRRDPARSPIGVAEAVRRPVRARPMRRRARR